MAADSQKRALNPAFNLQVRNKMTEIEWHDDLIDEICRCAYLVASGDGELFEEEESSLGEVRGYCRSFIDARKAVELVEETNNIKKARTLFDPDMPLMHNVSSIFLTYLDATQAAVSAAEDRDGYLELVDSQASKITDRYFQLVTAFAAERVAKADGELNFMEREAFNRLFASWDITYQEYEYWFAKYASAVVFGHYFDQGIELEDFEAKEDADEDDISDMLAELFGVDSFEELAESLEELEEEETKIEDLPDIYQAIIADDVSLLLEGLEADADPNLKIEISGIKGLTPLMVAAERTSLEMVTALTEYGANLDDVTDELGYTPLLWAIKGDNEDIAKFLIDRGANIEPFAEGEADWSPLSMAALHHLPGLAKILLANGATPNWGAPSGMTPLKHVCNTQETEEALELIELLLENKADPNLHDDEGFYPIHNAIDRGNAEITDLLLRNGVPVDLCFPESSEEFGSLLKRACMRANPVVLKLILDRLPDAKYTEDKTPQFVMFDKDGAPTLDDSEGFELIATVLMHGYKDELDRYDIRESVELLCENGIKPDLVGLCYAFLYPDMAESIMPHCKKELKELLRDYPELLLAYVVGLLNSGDYGIKYFTGISDLWFHAIKSMKACGIDVPEGLELEE